MAMWMMLALLSTARGADSITFEALTTVPEGDAPTVTFASRTTGGITVSLTCAGRTYSLKEAVRPGSTHTLELQGIPRGTYRCGGQLRLDESDGAWAEMPLSFEGEVRSTLDWSYTAEDVDLQAKTLVAHPSRPLKQASVELVGLGGEVVGSGPMDLTDPSNPTFSWTTDAEVLKLVVVGTDDGGIRGQLTLSPWSYMIPHDDVVFETNQHAIRSGEEPKLTAVWSDVTEVLNKYGDIVDIELFVGGYTDTVGDPRSNQALSERRARAIAQWFRANGFDRPIWYQGFGEDALAVATPDETDEEQNRRAIYLLAADKPPINDELPRGNWKRL